MLFATTRTWLTTTEPWRVHNHGVHTSPPLPTSFSLAEHNAGILPCTPYLKGCARPPNLMCNGNLNEEMIYNTLKVCWGNRPRGPVKIIEDACALKEKAVVDPVTRKVEGLCPCLLEPVYFNDYDDLKHLAEMLFSACPTIHFAKNLKVLAATHPNDREDSYPLHGAVSCQREKPPQYTSICANCKRSGSQMDCWLASLALWKSFPVIVRSQKPVEQRHCTKSSMVAMWQP